MVRQTSIAAYNYIITSGVLSKRRLQVYTTLYHHGPLTTGECCREIQKTAPSVQLNGISPRFDELNDRGLITEVGKRICSVTNREVLAWDVTSNYPKAAQKTTKPSPPSNHDLQAALQELQHLETWFGTNLSAAQYPGLAAIKNYLPHALVKGRW